MYVRLLFTALSLPALLVSLCHHGQLCSAVAYVTCVHTPSQMLMITLCPVGKPYQVCMAEPYPRSRHVKLFTLALRFVHKQLPLQKPLTLSLALVVGGK